MTAKILVIEDSASVRRLIEVCLRVLDIELHAAEDGIRGLDAARSELPDIIKHGVPDVASHATWATRQWSFHCTDVENNADCQCEPPS